MGPRDSSPAGGPRNAGGLIGFQQRRLDLADMLRAVLPVAHAHAYEQREQEIRALLTRLAAGRFQLAVAGQFSRGKTTLMNALLGGAYLPMGALPMTSVVTTGPLRNAGTCPGPQRAAGLPIEVPVTDVARFIAQASAERTRMQVASVEVEIPAELLRLGFEFVDTAGAAEFLAQAAGQAGKLFLVINKRDLVTGTAADEVTEYVQQWARWNLPQCCQAAGVRAVRAARPGIGASARQPAARGQ